MIDNHAATELRLQGLDYVSARAALLLLFLGLGRERSLVRLGCHNSGSFSAAWPLVVIVVYERDNGICGICGDAAEPTDFHVDHIIPLARGGEHSYANCQVAHPTCNRVKNARLVTP